MSNGLAHSWGIRENDWGSGRWTAQTFVSPIQEQINISSLDTQNTYEQTRSTATHSLPVSVIN